MVLAEPAEPIGVPNTLRLPQTMDQTAAESTPVEMSTFSRQMDGAVESTEPTTTVQTSIPEPEASTSAHAGPSTIPSSSSHQTDGPPSQPIATASHQPQPQAIDTTPRDPASATSDRPETLTHTPTTPAIGPSSDKPTPHLPDSSAQTLFITLLLTNGARHPYKIDEKYLQKRNVTVEGNNPVLMSIYTLKELIWREWREEWEARPSSPSSIRLIYAGFMPGDNTRLQECRFQLGPTPHVVHMTVKPQSFIDEEEAHKGGGREREAERSPRCRCCVM